MASAGSRADSAGVPSPGAAGGDDPSGLRWSTDADPGYTRRRCGRGFSYRDTRGLTIRDRATVDRIRSLAIPPAWSDVWIAPDPRGHLQATGRDARGRKQYRYHPAYRDRRERAKFDRLPEFLGSLPRIRAAVDADLARPGLPREKVLALVVRLLELTLIRVGNDEYARLNRSFGLTTLRSRHARVDGGQVRFVFKGKSGRRHDVTLRDRRLAAVVRRCRDLPGQELFQYVEPDGTRGVVRSEDVNAYLREAAGADVTAKDFRTWAGTSIAFEALRDAPPAEGEAAARRAIAEAVDEAAARLGNTRAVAQRSYVHPAVIDAFREGRLPASTGHRAPASPDSPAGEERALLRLLRRERGGDPRS